MELLGLMIMLLEPRTNRLEDVEELDSWRKVWLLLLLFTTMIYRPFTPEANPVISAGLDPVNI